MGVPATRPCQARAALAGDHRCTDARTTDAVARDELAACCVPLRRLDAAAKADGVDVRPQFVHQLPHLLRVALRRWRAHARVLARSRRRQARRVPPPARVRGRTLKSSPRTSTPDSRTFIVAAVLPYCRHCACWCGCEYESASSAVGAAVRWAVRELRGRAMAWGAPDSEPQSVVAKLTRRATGWPFETVRRADRPDIRIRLRLRPDRVRIPG